MKNIYKTYFAPALVDTINNFFDTNIYVTWLSHDYIWKEDRFKGIEAFWMWEVYEIENWLWKYIKAKALWKIKRIWTIEATYNEEKKKFDLFAPLDLEWNHIDLNIDEDEFKKQINDTFNIRYQLHHSSKDNWNNKEKWLFIEVEKANAFEDNVLYKQKDKVNLVTAFWEKWELLKNNLDYTYFKMYSDIYYNIERWVLSKWEDQKPLAWWTRELKMKLMNYILFNFPNLVLSDELYRELWFKWVDKDKKLWELKDSLINDFEKFWLSKEEVKENIIIANKWEWYRLKGEFTFQSNLE